MKRLGALYYPSAPSNGDDSADWLSSHASSTSTISPISKSCFVTSAAILASGQRVPDPASRAQAGDVNDCSIVIDPTAYQWRNRHWRGRPWPQTVLYELHCGALGGFRDVAGDLPRLAALGITAVELMPINDFLGRRNWGYDDVLPFAPDTSDGTTDELKALIDVAHDLNLMIFLDVVYNHFGPDGNYLASYAPSMFRDDLKTPLSASAVPGWKWSRKASSVVLARAHSQMVVNARRDASDIVPVTAPTRSMFSRKSGFCTVAHARVTISRKSVLVVAALMVSSRFVCRLKRATRSSTPRPSTIKSSSGSL
jgi:Alpha amylase, catalytic domain